MAETSADDEKYFRTVTVKITERYHLGGHESRERIEVIQISAENLHARAAAAVATYPTEVGTDPICVISHDRPPEGTFVSQEHFVPEGLGFGWAGLPRGTGTCDRINAEFSRYEAEWLRQGMMGCFRPFFVAEGKDEPPVYFAPSKNKKLVWLTREPDGRRVLCFGPDVKQNLPDEAGRGVLTIRVPRSQARPAWVSLALHKMAFLTLWLCRGSMALDAGFEPLRAFLLTPTKDTYRPFCQEMTTGAPPGVEVHFLVNFDGTIDGARATFDVRDVHARMRVHHMRYGLGLMGTASSMAAELAPEPWRDPSEKPLDTTPIQFGFETLKLLMTREQVAEVAYYRWLDRASEHGRDLEDWFEAERSLRGR